MEPEKAEAGRSQAADEALLEDEKAARELENLINKRLAKVQRDQDEILKLTMRVQRYRQEIQRLSLKRAERLTLRLAL